MTDTEQELLAMFIEKGKVDHEILLRERAEELERKINALPLYVELIRDSLEDEKLREHVEELGRLENMMNLAPDSLRPFVDRLHTQKAQEFFEDLDGCKNESKRVKEI